MTLKIHPTAKVHPSAVLEGDVEIGPETTIGALTYIEGPVVIGARNKIYPHCVIGCGPEHKAAAPTGPILIGDDNVIRELTVVQRGTGDRTTEIGSRTFIMDHVHVAHDCYVGDDATIAPNTVFAGHVHAHRGCNVGVGVVIHQFSTIGAFTMIGMGAVVTKDVPPFALVTGTPARFVRFNTHGIKRAGIPEAAVRLVDGKVVCEHELAAPLFEAFNRSARRKLLPCVPARGGDEA